jgi:hypothetical protein
MSHVTSKTINALSLLTKDELKEHEDISTLANILKVITVGNKEFTTEELATEIIRNNYYLFRLTTIKGEVGFYINGVFTATNTNYSPTSNPPVAGKPDTYLLTVTDGTDDNSLTISCSVPTGTKQKDMFAIDDLADNPDNLAKIAKLIIPVPVSSLPNGTYKVKSIDKKEKIGVITLEDGTLVNVNKSTPDGVKEITSKNGYLYMSVNGSLKRGISLTGAVVPVAYTVEDAVIGQVYTVHGVSTNTGEYGDYSSAKLSLLGETETQNYSIPNEVVQYALTKLSKVDSFNIRIESATPAKNPNKPPKIKFSVVAG